MQEQACGALRNLSILPANKQRLAQLDAIPALIQLLSSPHEEVQAQACMVLQNLSKSADCRHLIVQQGGIPPLIALLWSFNEHVQEHSAGIVANLSVNADNARTVKWCCATCPGLGLGRLGQNNPLRNTQTPSGAIRIILCQ